MSFAWSAPKPQITPNSIGNRFIFFSSSPISCRSFSCEEFLPSPGRDKMHFFRSLLKVRPCILPDLIWPGSISGKTLAALNETRISFPTPSKAPGSAISLPEDLWLSESFCLGYSLGIFPPYANRHYSCVVSWIVLNSAGPTHTVALQADSFPPPYRSLTEQIACRRMQHSSPTVIKGHTSKDVCIFNVTKRSENINNYLCIE